MAIWVPERPYRAAPHGRALPVDFNPGVLQNPAPQSFPLRGYVAQLVRAQHS